MEDLMLTEEQKNQIIVKALKDREYKMNANKLYREKHPDKHRMMNKAHYDLNKNDESFRQRNRDKANRSYQKKMARIRMEKRETELIEVYL